MHICNYAWVFVFFRCGDVDKVLTLHQENIIRLPSCPDSDLCDFRKMNSYYSDSIDNCDFESICDINE